jgi:hypothetical protein
MYRGMGALVVLVLLGPTVQAVSRGQLWVAVLIGIACLITGFVFVSLFTLYARFDFSARVIEVFFANGLFRRRFGFDMMARISSGQISGLGYGVLLGGDATEDVNAWARALVFTFKDGREVRLTNNNAYLDEQTLSSLSERIRAG